jgi:lipoprotein signal peptidase
MGSRRGLIIGVGIATATADLVAKALAVSPLEHPRSPAIVVLSAGVVIALVVLVPKLPSRAAAVAAGLGAGGAVGNGLSIVLFGAVPDPLVLKAVAFNLADVFALTGAAGLVSAVGLYALRHPHALRQPL